MLRERLGDLLGRVKEADADENGNEGGGCSPSGELTANVYTLKLVI
jgi:hypothetical protein